MSGMVGLGKFLKRATHKLQEKTGRAGAKTVDEEFERCKSAFMKHRDFFQSWVRKVEAYYKGQSGDSDNYGRVVEATAALGHDDAEFKLVSAVSMQARAELEASFQELKQRIAQYTDVLKFLSKRIDARDGARVDLDMKRAKLEKAGDDPVARATCSASLQVYEHVNAQVIANLEMFIGRINSVMRAFTTAVSMHQYKLFSAMMNTTEPKQVAFPDFGLQDYNVAAPVVTQQPIVFDEPQRQQRPQRSPRQEAQQRQQAKGYSHRKPEPVLMPADEPEDHSGTVTGLYDYTAEEGDGGLSFRAGDKLTVTEKSEDGDWWYAYDSRGGEGYVPVDFVS